MTTPTDAPTTPVPTRLLPLDERPDPQLRYLQQCRARTQSVLARLPPELQGPLSRYLTQRRLDRRAPNSDATLLYQWRTVARDLQGRRPESLSALEWLDLVEQWRERPGRRGGPTTDSTVSARATAVSSALPFFYAPAPVPPDVLSALRPKRPEWKLNPGRLVTDDQFQLLLNFVAHHDRQYHRPRDIAEVTALLHCMREVGARPNELLGLNIGDVEFREDGGFFRMHDGQVLAKTGLRAIAMMTAAAPLKVWLGLHPGGSDPAKPLFCALRSPSGSYRLSLPALDKMLRRLGDLSGANSTRLKKISAYDFRHTAATAAAKHNWAPSKANKQFGWKGKSMQWQRYSQMTEEDVRQQLLRDNGLTPTGERLPNVEGAPPEVVAALALLRKSFPQLFAAAQQMP